MRENARSTRLLRHGLHVVALALIGTYVLTFVLRNVALQWDFKVYMLAARAALAGLNPYRLEDLAVIAHKTVLMPFVYPPIGLLPFLAMVSLPPAGAAMCWIVLKSLILAGLIFAWSRWMVPDMGVLAVALVAVFGWNASALTDLRAGNVALLECGLLWAAFACFIAERRAAFAALVLAAAIFKVAPAGYLLLLLAPTRRHGSEPIRLACLAAIGAALIGLPLVVGPAAHWRGFGSNIPNALTLLDANPSAFALAVKLTEWCGATGSMRDPVAAGIWLTYCLALVAVSLPFLKDSWRARDAKRLVIIAVFLEVLVAPRPMSYGFAILGPAPLFFGRAVLRRPGWGLLLALIFAAQGLALSAHQQIDTTLVIFSPLLLTLGLWLIVVRGAPEFQRVEGAAAGAG